MGGLIGPRTSKRQFKKQLELLVDVAVAWVQRAAAKDAYIRASLLANVITLQPEDADPSAAVVFWTKHPLPSLESWNADALVACAWSALTQNDRERVAFYQNLTAALLMYYSKLYLASPIIMMLTRELAHARRNAVLSTELRVDARVPTTTRTVRATPTLAASSSPSTATPSSGIARSQCHVTQLRRMLSSRAPR